MRAVVVLRTSGDECPAANIVAKTGQVRKPDVAFRIETRQAAAPCASEAA
ncbi:MAG TPA: hypothetical protein VJW96_05755 [Terriglobales bacterium]|nr:hypothetical protein [Terriglobales bacterium]